MYSFVLHGGDSREFRSHSRYILLHFVGVRGSPVSGFRLYEQNEFLIEVTMRSKSISDISEILRVNLLPLKVRSCDIFTDLFSPRCSILIQESVQPELACKRSNQNEDILKAWITNTGRSKAWCYHSSQRPRSDPNYPPDLSSLWKLRLV